MRSVKLVLTAAIALMVVAIGVVLSRAPLTVAGTNSISTAEPVAYTRGNASTCQAGTLPRNTSGIRVSLSAGAGPRLHVVVSSGSRVVTQGERPPGWGLEANVVVPIRATSHTIRNAQICIAVGPAAEPVAVLGAPAAHGATSAHGLKGVKLRLEYLRPGSRSWWSLASSIPYHLGLGHAAHGQWLAYLVLTLMIAVAAIATRLASEELR